MRIYEIMLSCITVLIYLNLLLVILYREKTADNVVSMPKLCLILGIFLNIAAFGLMAASIFLNFSMILLILSICFAVLSCMFLVMYYSLRIYYNYNKFVVKRLFRKTRTFRYSEIQSVIPGSGMAYTLVCNNGKVYVDSFAVGGMYFYVFAEQRFIKGGGGNSIPESRPKLFNGNVIEPIPIVVISIIIGLAWLAIAIWFTVEYFNGGLIAVKDLLIIWGVVAVYAVILIISNYILCNAQKYPRIAALLIKKENRNW